jgi:hypothetical protein
MFCTGCGAAIEEGVTVCSQCGTEVPKASNPSSFDSQTSNQYHHPPGASQSQGNFLKFINFDIMITTMIMKILYVGGSALIIIIALVGVFAGDGWMALVALIAGAIALVYYRVICEFIIVYFKIHENVRGVRENTENK